MTKKKLLLKHAGALTPDDHPQEVDPQEVDNILDTLDKVLESAHISQELPCIVRKIDIRDNVIDETMSRKVALYNMVKKRNWNTYNELATHLGKKRECDLSYAFFERLVGIALGDIVDHHDSAKYCILLLNTIFDEKRSLMAHPGYHMPVATIEDVNKASQKVIELLGEGAISLDVADKFHKLLQSRIAIIQDTEISIELDELKKRIGLD